MPFRNPRRVLARLSATLLTFIVVATLLAALPGSALGSTTRRARCDGANLRAHASTSAKTRMRMPAGTRVIVSGKVTGGHWKTHCGGGTHSGNTWLKITSVDGKSIRKRFGVPFLYGAVRLYRKVAAPSTAPAPTTSCTRRVGVDKTGSTDVTAELQRFIDGSPGGSVICFASDGRYKVNGTLHIQNRNHLTLDGNGATVFQTSRSTSRIWLIDGNSNDISLHHLTIKGANPRPGTWDAAYEHNHAIQIGGATHVNLGHLRLLNFGGDGLYIGAGRANGSVRWADSIDLHDSTIDGTGRSGISIADGGSNVHIDHNTFRHIAFYTLNIEPNGQVYDGQPAGARNVRFSYNTLGAQPYGTGVGEQPVGHVFVVTGSSGGGPADGISVSHNTISGEPFDVGVYNNGGSRHDIRITDNRSDTSAPGPVMAFSGVSTLVVTGNVQPLDGSTLVTTSGCTDVTISGNVTP